MLDDSHEWLLFLAGRGLGKSSSPLLIVRDPKWGRKMQDRISKSLSGKRRPTWEKELGYTLADLRAHLEAQFIAGMTWDNYAGNNEWRAQNVWVVDHIVPKTLFSREQSARAFCLSNLRPLWAEQNMRKAARRTHLL